MNITTGILLVVSVIGLLLVAQWLFRPDGGDRERQAAIDDARAQCRQWADKLDKQTTETGIYVRWQGETLPDKDPWGNELRIDYSQGGVAESLTVRSFGPDGKSHTDDDIVEQRQSVNFKGVGTGIKKNAEETARHVGKGLVKGIIESGREAIHGEKKSQPPRE
jgi:hypothetical protein